MMKRGMKNKAAGLMQQAFAPPAVVLPSAKVSGIVKSYNDKKGYGFIQSPRCPTDVYFKGDNVTGDISVGGAVTFALKAMPDGKAHAIEVGPTLAAGKVAKGSVMSFNAAKGYGFISVPGQNGDFFFSARDFPNASVGQSLKFAVQISPEGKIQAPTAPSSGAKRPAIAMTKKLTGQLGGRAKKLTPEGKMQATTAPSSGAKRPAIAMTKKLTRQLGGRAK